MNPLLILGGLAALGFVVATQTDLLKKKPNFRGTGASEKAYWEGRPDGRYISIPGRVA
jgi:hypothetical protein